MAAVPESEASESPPEEVEGVIVGDVRRLPGRRSTGEMVATQAAVVGGSFVAGAVAAAVVARRRRSAAGRRSGRRRRQQVAATRSFLVDVHMLGR
ncbi:MAG: hypothetical protein FGM34_01510 [Solirubrobacteraceae bacterium]|nr:hypothetical protein [Solirubrobacteraceae bacterium]